MWRWNDRTHGGRAEVYPRALSEDWFFFFSVLWYLAAEAFRGGKNGDRLSFYLPLPPFFFPILGGPFVLYISFSLILVVHLLIIQVAT